MTSRTRRALVIGLMIGVVRAAIACTGWYIVEHDAGAAQVPAYAMTMVALPEAALLGRTRGIAGPDVYVKLSLLVMAGSILLVLLLERAFRRRHRP